MSNGRKRFTGIREREEGGAVKATQKQAVIMTLWGQRVFWPDHVLRLNNRLWTRTRILNCVKMFARGLNSSKNRSKMSSTHSLGPGPRCLLFITRDALISVKINHIFAAEILSGSPRSCPLDGRHEHQVFYKEWMNRWFYLLKCLLIHTDILGMKSIYFVITAKKKKRKVQFGEFSWCFGIEISV